MRTPHFGIVGYKDNGKTTLVVRLVRHLTAQGLRVSTIKHAHHEVDIDQPGKDTWRHREAGTTETVLATSRRYAIVHELRERARAFARASPGADESGRSRDRRGLQAAWPRRSSRCIASARGRLCWRGRTRPSSRSAADGPLDGLGVPLFDLDDIPSISDFILARTRPEGRG